jgi:hypothetical protein
MTEESFDLALTSSKIDADLLKEKVKSHEYDYVNFFPDEAFFKDSTSNNLLILLPFIGEENVTFVSRILMKELHTRSDFQKFSHLSVRPHPRSDLNSVSTLETLLGDLPISFSLDYDFHASLFSEVSRASEVILFRSSSTLRLVQRCFPSKLIKILVDMEEIPDESGSLSPRSFSEKVVELINGMGGKDEDTSYRAC